jgi:hypothetical protein
LRFGVGRELRPVLKFREVDREPAADSAATWLRQTTGDARLVAEYLGHADLSTVSRYTHVARGELRSAVQTLADTTELRSSCSSRRSRRAPQHETHSTTARSAVAPALVLAI